MSPVPWVAGVRMAWAVVLLARPRTVMTLALAPIVLAGAAVLDALPAPSFLGFAAVHPARRWRRAGPRDVATASVFSAASTASRRAFATHSEVTATLSRPAAAPESSGR